MKVLAFSDLRGLTAVNSPNFSVLNNLALSNVAVRLYKIALDARVTTVSSASLPCVVVVSCQFSEPVFNVPPSGNNPVLGSVVRETSNFEFSGDWVNKRIEFDAGGMFVSPTNLLDVQYSFRKEAPPFTASDLAVTLLTFYFAPV
jgi:hypothetical protein